MRDRDDSGIAVQDDRSAISVFNMCLVLLCTDKFYMLSAVIYQLYHIEPIHIRFWDC